MPRAKNVRVMGNTSTDVEKTHVGRTLCRRHEKHLHGRGEDALATSKGVINTETPPRTWRRRAGETPEMSRDGNTSTDVEKTRYTIVELRF